jgi:hypothetical protein
MKCIAAAVALALVSCHGGENPSMTTAEIVTPRARPAAAPTISSAEKIYEIGGDVLPPKRLSSCDPKIPEQIKGRRIAQPIFTYEIVVSAEGRVVAVVLERASQTGDPYDSLKRAFRKAIVSCRFEPAIRNGVPVAVRMMMVTRTEVR